MATPSIRSSDEILSVNQAGYFPQVVHNEGDSLRINVNIHSFFWDYDGPRKVPDFEPVAVDINKQYSLTRFHYRGLFLWLDYRLETSKPIVKFYSPFHTPLLCTGYKPHKLKEPTKFEDIFAYDVLLWGHFLSDEIPEILSGKNIYKTSGYHDKSSPEDVPHDKTFTWDDLEYVVIVGPTRDLSKINIPVDLKDKITQILNKP